MKNYNYEFWDILVIPKWKNQLDKVNKISLFIEAMNNYKMVKEFNFFLCSGNVFKNWIRYYGYSNEKIDIDQLNNYLKKRI